MRLLLATRNPHKVEEISSLLTQLSLELLDLSRFPEVNEPPETGKTFEENAQLKATFWSKSTEFWTLADDSGLEVAALDNRPGILSKRYASTNPERIAKLLEEMKDLTEEHRKARFVCAACLASPQGQFHLRRGSCYGTIAFSPRGTHGFGYDPVFLLPGLEKTMAELSLEEKNQVSHRADALKQLLPLLTSLSHQP